MSGPPPLDIATEWIGAAAMPKRATKRNAGRDRDSEAAIKAVRIQQLVQCGDVPSIGRDRLGLFAFLAVAHLVQQRLFSHIRAQTKT